MISFKEFVDKKMEVETLDEILISTDGQSYELYEGRKWVAGRFKQSIGVDQSFHNAGQTHAHVYGRKRNELGVVNIDGTGSHGTKMKLHDKDAEALRNRGFDISKDGIVEWSSLGLEGSLLLG